MSICLINNDCFHNMTVVLMLILILLLILIRIRFTIRSFQRQVPDLHINMIIFRYFMIQFRLSNREVFAIAPTLFILRQVLLWWFMFFRHLTQQFWTVSSLIIIMIMILFHQHWYWYCVYLASAIIYNDSIINSSGQIITILMILIVLLLHVLLLLLLTIVQYTFIRCRCLRPGGPCYCFCCFYLSTIISFQHKVFDNQYYFQEICILLGYIGWFCWW